MINSTVLVSDALHFSATQAINPYYHDSNTDIDKAQAEHDEIIRCFKQAGITVVTVPSPTTSQDGVYTANWALVRGKRAVLARLPDVRKSEEEYARTRLEEQGIAVETVPNNLRFSGQGDALACGNYLLCGSKYRSDEIAQDYAANTLGFERIQLQTIPQLDKNNNEVVNVVSGWPDSFFYDIDLALAILRHPANGQPGLIAYCPDAFTPESCHKVEALTGIEKIQVSMSEAMHAFALNLVSTGSSVIMSDSAPEFKSQLEARGFTVYTPHIEELAKGGGYIRCISLALD